MENWVWVSLYLLQTLIGAVLWKRFYKKESTLDALIGSSLIFINIIGFFYLLGKSLQYLIKQLCNLIDFLAGVKK